MKVLLCHAYYTERGGEDRSFEEERELLLAHGHEVVSYVRRNEELTAYSPLAIAGATLWNRRAARDVANLIRRESPDVLHVTNTFPIISPAVCHVAHRAGVAVVQALRNYRLLCAGAKLMRDDRPCHDCVGRLTPWPAVRHRCYRDSAVASAAAAAMQVLHRTLGTWRRKVDAYFTLTNFARQQFVDAGFPADRIHVKHNCVHPDPGVGDGAGRYAMFAGRLSREKGVATLLAAWQTNPSLPPLKIAGDGPLAPDVQSAAARDARIDWLGRLPEPDVHRLMGAASVVLLPSVWYETFGRTIAEAYAGGTPVIASNLGAMAELVRDDQTGWLVRAGDAPALAAKVRAVLSLPAGVLVEFRRRARVEYEARFTPAANYSRLVEIYAAALAAAKTRSEPARQSGKLCDATPRRATTERSSLSPALKISTSE